MSCFKYNDFVTSVAYYPESSNVFLNGTSSDGIFANDSRSGKVHIFFYRTLRSRAGRQFLKFLAILLRKVSNVFLISLMPKV